MEAAIEVQREKVRDLERRARQREIENTTRRLESRRERAEDLELRARRHKHHSPPLNQREMYAVRIVDELQQGREQQRKHDKASRKRIEQRRVSEQLELARREKMSLDDRREETSLDRDTIVARNWELAFRAESASSASTKQKIVQDRTGMGVGVRGEGARQRPVSSQQAPSSRRGRERKYEGFVRAAGQHSCG
ncbi:hypothetical protein DL98DRAFT_637052 [Cadophora sp. DSE1049]|nr:hypothetical protein DL98DRAFT_637052 [Cadophora sp. DSE1049]